MDKEMKLALIGFGDLGRYVKDMLQEFHPVEEGDISYFDDNLYRDRAPNAYPFGDFASEAFKDAHFYVCLGYKHLAIKNEIVAQLVDLKRTVPHFVHPSAYVHGAVQIGEGSFIYPSCSIDRGTVIGRGTWIMNGTVVAHDCKIGNGCWLGVGVTLCGRVSINDHAFIGSGVTVANDLHIGSDVVIGLETSVTKNVDNGVSAIGNPMRILNKPLKLV